MGEAFMCSLCHKGILGGGLYLDAQAVTYRTQKLTVDPKYKVLALPLKEIESVEWKWILFPVATFRMKNGEKYRFLIFNKMRFTKYYQEYRDNHELREM